MTLQQALELLAQPKAQRRGFGVKREPLKIFEGVSPVTKQPVQLFDGRYGLYVTDGVTNASLPKSSTPEEVTLELALRLLADRAAAGPTKNQLRKAAKAKRAAAPAAAAKKKSAKPRSPAAKREEKSGHVISPRGSRSSVLLRESASSSPAGCHSWPASPILISISRSPTVSRAPAAFQPGRR